MPDNVPVVLIVDADPETHLVTDGSLADGECMFLSARSAEMGLKLAERRPPSVLVVDAKLGGLGYLTERLRRLSPHIHLVLIVAPDDGVEAASARLGGTGSMLRKPLDVTRVRSTLRTVLRLSAMSAGVKRMHGVGYDGGRPPIPPGPAGRDGRITTPPGGEVALVPESPKPAGRLVTVGARSRRPTPMPRVGNGRK